MRDNLKQTWRTKQVFLVHKKQSTKLIQSLTSLATTRPVFAALLGWWYITQAKYALQIFLDNILVDIKHYYGKLQS